MQQTLSKLTNALSIQERRKFSSRPQQNPRGVHEVEANEGNSNSMKEVKAIMTLRSGKKIIRPSPPISHEEEIDESPKKGG